MHQLDYKIATLIQMDVTLNGIYIYYNNYVKTLFREIASMSHWYNVHGNNQGQEFKAYARTRTYPCNIMATSK